VDRVDSIILFAANGDVTNDFLEIRGEEFDKAQRALADGQRVKPPSTLARWSTTSATSRSSCT
jgi:hypothetical protein